MSERRGAVSGGVFRLASVTMLWLGCTSGGGEPAAVESSWSALLDDGDASTIAPGAMVPALAIALQTRSCPSGDCSRDPLAFWTFDDRNRLSTQLSDTAFTSLISHPAFRAVSVACVAGIDNGAVQLSVTLSPGQTAPEVAGSTAPFDLSVTNTSGAACPVDTFAYRASLPFPLTADVFGGVLSAGPGQTAHATVNVRVCSASACFGPFSEPVTAGTTVVDFTDMSGGMPLA